MPYFVTLYFVTLCKQPGREENRSNAHIDSAGLGLFVRGMSGMPCSQSPVGYSEVCLPSPAGNDDRLLNSQVLGIYFMHSGKQQPSWPLELLHMGLVLYPSWLLQKNIFACRRDWPDVLCMLQVVLMSGCSGGWTGFWQRLGNEDSRSCWCL